MEKCKFEWFYCLGSKRDIRVGGKQYAMSTNNLVKGHQQTYRGRLFYEYGVYSTRLK